MNTILLQGLFRLRKAFLIVCGIMLLTAASRAQTPINVGPQLATFSSMVRGYHFTAPVSFTICGLYIPTDASMDPQSVEVVKFTSAAPPAYTATTNAFTSLFYQANWVPNTMIPCNIQVNVGDIIGVYGARGTGQVNSYGGTAFATTILGSPVTLNRSGMQFSLATQQMHDIWSENGPIGRIIMYINCCNAPAPVVTSPVTYCQYATPQQLTATGTNLRWYTTATGGTPSLTAPTPNTATPGSTTYYVSSVGTSPANCESARVPIVVDVNAKPGLPVINAVPNYCPGAPFVPFQVTGQGVKWYTTPTGGTGTTTTPTVNTNNPGTYTWYASQTILGCEGDRATVSVTVYPNLDADFNYTIKYGCGEDTVIFNNTSTGTHTYQWDFGDGGGDTAKNPVHIYKNQGIFNVKLRSLSDHCKDSMIRQIDLVHPLDASFEVDDDSVCQFQTVNFTSTSVTTTRLGIDPSYYWDFGDGNSGTGFSTFHTYTRPGVYRARLVVQDFVPCTDTAWMTIIVDSLPHARILVTDTSVCEGTSIAFDIDYLKEGSTGTIWDFGDGTIMANWPKIGHAYDIPGTYNVSFTSSYRICDDVTDTRQVTVRGYPALNLGPDTAICPNGMFVRLADQASLNDPSVTYMWNTGATAFSILVNQPGIYYAYANRDGCQVVDSVEVRKDCYLDIPNVFTPGSDGMNDYFLPRQLLSSGITRFKMNIYNRWGQQMFETTSLNGRGWDGRLNGTDQPQGVYVYIIDVTYHNGHREQFQGNVTLLR